MERTEGDGQAMLSPPSEGVGLVAPDADRG